MDVGADTVEFTRRKVHGVLYAGGGRVKRRVGEGERSERRARDTGWSISPLASRRRYRRHRGRSSVRRFFKRLELDVEREIVASVPFDSPQMA